MAKGYIALCFIFFLHVFVVAGMPPFVEPFLPSLVFRGTSILNDDVNAMLSAARLRSGMIPGYWAHS